MNISNDIPERIDTFFKRLIYTLIVLNVLIGVPTIYDIYFYEEAPTILRDTSIIPTNEI
jgi:hypothetical protein